VLSTFGFASLGIVEDDFAQLGYVIQLGQPPARIDLLTSLTGVEFIVNMVLSLLSKGQRLKSPGKTKTDVVVPVAPGVPVVVSRAQVPREVAPGAAAQHPTLAIP